MSRRSEQKGFHCSCRLWNVGVLIILALTVLNVLTVLKLLHTGCTKIYFEPRKFLLTSSSSPKPSTKQEIRIKKPISNNSLSFNVDPHLGRWDAQRQYKMIDQALVGARYLKLSEEYSVCLATQTSVEKLYSLVQVTIHWSGPISIAIFVVSDEEYAVVQEYVKFIRQCFPQVRNQVSFHLAFPKELVPSSSPPRKKISEWNCQKPIKVLQGLLDQTSEEIKQWHLANPYPQNHMRNLARKNCQSPQVFLTDVDIIPSFGAAEGLNEFFKTVNCSKCAYVVPTYEVSTNSMFPKTKSQLVRLTLTGHARPFHQKIFLYNSFATNHSRWEADTEQKPVHISHNVSHLKFYYEPFYVSRDSAPSHDERFIGYGLTKNTQVYEMFVAGYEFLVLSPIFTIHWGLQNNLKRPWWREWQTNYNYRKLFFFKREIYARYNYRPTQIISDATKTGNLSTIAMTGTSNEIASSRADPEASTALAQHQSTNTTNKNLTNYRFQN